MMRTNVFKQVLMFVIISQNFNLKLKPIRRNKKRTNHVKGQIEPTEIVFFFNEQTN